MKKKNTHRFYLILLLALVFSAFTRQGIVVNSDNHEEQLDFRINAEGDGLIIWGYSWMPPYPGEGFYLGGPGPDPPIVPFPLFNWGTPEYSSKLTNSLVKITGSSYLEEAPVRTDTPEELPTDLTKYWLRNQNSTGLLVASWENDEISHSLQVNLTGVSSGGVWVGPPATCPWGHFALGFVSPSVPITPVVFEGLLDEEPVDGMMQIISWPDIMMANLWINDGADGTYLNLIWVNPESYMTHEWLTYWLAFNIELPEFGYLIGDDPLAAWVPPADILYREFKVGEYVTNQPDIRYWSDDFEDGDYNGWKITGYNFEPFFVDMMTPPIPIKGNYTAEGKTLQSLGPRKPGLAGVASHPSTVAYGTWSFDLQITEETEEHFYVYFATDDWHEYPLKINSYDLAIVLQPGQAWSWELEEDAQSGFVLVKRNGGVLEGGWQGLGSHSLYNELSGSYHIDITRDSKGNFKVYLDGVLIIEAQDNEYTTSTWFRFTGEPGPAIDNIVVKDTIDVLAQNLDEKVSTQNKKIIDIETEKNSLEEENIELEDEKNSLTSQISSLEETVNTLEDQISSLEDSGGSSQMYIIIALIVGLIAGAAAIYLTKR
jgi:hypothetical protein